MFHLHIRYLSRDAGTSTEGTRQYIAREGRFAKRGDTVRWIKSLHMPSCAEASTSIYWRAAEGSHSRANARTAILVQFALPADLHRPAQDVLALDMAEWLSAFSPDEEAPSGRLAVTLALHEGYGRNPHVHLMLSTSINDGIERPLEQWFRRFNARAPERGGARRSNFVTKRRWLYSVRQAWAELANAALKANELGAILDHRSHAARGIARVPSIHLGPTTAYMSRMGKPTARSDRFTEIEERNAESLQMQARVSRRRRILEGRDRDCAIFETNRRQWTALRDESWREMLWDHPFAADEPSALSHACVMVTESDSYNRAALFAAFARPEMPEKIRKMIGPTWELAATSAGIWLIRPNCDEVVMLGKGYALTDSTDEETIAKMLRVARLLPFESPVVAAWRNERSKVEFLLAVTGLDWPFKANEVQSDARLSSPRP